MALSAVAKRRLNTLIEYMDTLKVAGGHFKMRQWIAHKGRVATINVHGIDGKSPVKKEQLLECGMSACAAGWACTVPSFQRAGLMMKAGDFSDDTNLRPVYGGEEHFDAIIKFFDLNERQARRLFGPYRRDVNTPKEWATSARKIVAQFAAQE